MAQIERILVIEMKEVATYLSNLITFMSYYLPISCNSLNEKHIPYY
jgi:hypothetical protein